MEEEKRREKMEWAGGWGGWGKTSEYQDPRKLLSLWDTGSRGHNQVGVVSQCRKESVVHKMARR